MQVLILDGTVCTTWCIQTYQAELSAIGDNNNSDSSTRECSNGPLVLHRQFQNRGAKVGEIYI